MLSSQRLPCLNCVSHIWCCMRFVLQSRCLSRPCFTELLSSMFCFTELVLSFFVSQSWCSATPVSQDWSVHVLLHRACLVCFKELVLYMSCFTQLVMPSFFALQEWWRLGPLLQATGFVQVHWFIGLVVLVLPVVLCYVQVVLPMPSVPKKKKNDGIQFSRPTKAVSYTLCCQRARVEINCCP